MFVTLGSLHKSFLFRLVLARLYLAGARAGAMVLALPLVLVPFIFAIGDHVF